MKQTILFHNDFLPQSFISYLSAYLKKRFPEKDLLIHLSDKTDEIMPEAETLILAIGSQFLNTNDLNAYKSRINDEITKAKEKGYRLIPVSLPPSSSGKKENKRVDQFHKCLIDIVRKEHLKIIDLHSAFREYRIKFNYSSSRFPRRNYDKLCQDFFDIYSRSFTTVLWQYNGREAKCNYRCPYCYYIGLHSPRDDFFGTTEQWRQSYKHSFGNEKLMFYLAFGEPTIGGAFYDIVEMISLEANWSLRITTNASQDLTRLLESPLAKEKRLFINASFHPTETDLDSFIERVLKIKEAGVPLSIVYVTYPQRLDKLEEELETFARNGLVVHVRRYQGTYKKKRYPLSYTEEERQRIARYCDDGTIRYMLNQSLLKKEKTFCGLHFFIVDSAGNVGYDSNHFRPYTKYRCIFGNVHQNSFKPLLRPVYYPGIAEGTVDGVSNLIGAGYKELEGNNVLSFSEQGGVYEKGGQVVYKHRDTDFNNRKIRAQFNFPPRDILDFIYILGQNRLSLWPQVCWNQIFWPLRYWMLNHKKVHQLFRKLFR